MTEHDKEILLKDLCARLPYGVKCEVYGRIGILDEISSYGAAVNYNNGEDTTCRIECVKPYLFPLSSMTEEQKKTAPLESSILNAFINGHIYLFEDEELTIDDLNMLFDWLNKNHFDYRGLIPKGIAINATGLEIYKK